MNPTVRLATPSDISRPQAIDPWPRETVWRQKIANTEVMVLEVDDRVVGLEGV